MSNEIYESDSLKYSEVIANIKNEYKDKIENAIKTAREEMNRSAVTILGSEFANLAAERKKLIANYSEIAKKVLNFALTKGLRDEVQIISDWSKKYDKSKEKREEGTKIFNAIIEKVKKFDPQLVQELKDSENALKQNNLAMVTLIKSKKTQLAELQKVARAKLQGVLVALVVEFKKKVQVINQSYGVDNAKIDFPEIDTQKQQLDIAIEEDSSSEDDIFIPSGSDDIN